MATISIKYKLTINHRLQNQQCSARNRTALGWAETIVYAIYDSEQGLGYNGRFTSRVTNYMVSW